MEDIMNFWFIQNLHQIKPWTMRRRKIRGLSRATRDNYGNNEVNVHQLSHYQVAAWE
jgi:hypothetical protein